MGFDNIKVYGPEDLSEDFVKKTSPYISYPRGGGYWLWKSFLFKKTFEKMNNDDILIYADAGCHVNIHGKKRLQEYFDMIYNDKSGILSFDLGGFLEEHYTNEKVFEYFNISKDNNIRKTGIIAATIVIMRKCENTIDLVNLFYDIATKEPHLFSDEYNNYNRTDVFIDHRHDQSIFSILRKLKGSILIPDETYANDWNELMHVPILATRIRN